MNSLLGRIVCVFVGHRPIRERPVTIVSPTDAEDRAARAAARELGATLERAAKRGELPPADFHREMQRVWRAREAEVPPGQTSKPVNAWMCDRCKSFVVEK